MLKQYRVDLHIHTCLSPCADRQMTPRRIIETAIQQELDIIAVCDHNSAENVGALMDAAGDLPLTVLPGMEISAAEDVHMLAIFDSLPPALQLQKHVYQALPQKGGIVQIPGKQAVMNESDQVQRYNTRPLLSATALSLAELADIVHSLGGLVIPSHVDRIVFGLLGQYGEIPPDFKPDALEISANMPMNIAREMYPEINSYPLLTSSDAHYLSDIGAAFTTFTLAASRPHQLPDYRSWPGVEELDKAFKNREGRGTVLENMENNDEK